MLLSSLLGGGERERGKRRRGGGGRGKASRCLCGGRLERSEKLFELWPVVGREGVSRVTEEGRKGGTDH